MTPLLNDLDYLEEVTNCLTHTLARLLQTRPPDPITFIEHSLRQHRRQHPKQNQGKEACETTSSDENTAVASPADSSAAAGHKEPSRVDLTSGTPTVVATSVDGEPRAGIISNEKDNNSDDAIEDCIDLISPSLMVHSHIQTDLHDIGDLFDDFDFG
ncbi:hypothetical protein PoB_001104800 [Plakobranchus ocellatus]|uniref:Uncharacterized protein n=1 Tax=Plakobranchus ocellatus TaxID=259542 RepID=A0AAV3YPR0_9GAST|nr:hypothetical protein PoB_001104800 [Plakobranchus ocellatus]